MNPINIKLQNYRSFSLESPIEYEINEGITFILGQNNVGKSNAIRPFFEFRNLVSGQFSQSIKQQTVISNAGMPFPFDRYSNRKTPLNHIRIAFTINREGFDLSIVAQRGNRNDKQLVATISKSKKPDDEVAKQIDSLFSKSIYIGPFRSTDAKLGNKNFDISIGSQFMSQWNQWANGENTEQAEKIENLTEELREIFNFDKFRIDVNDNNNDLILTTDDGRFSIQELGSGISHFIVVLGNALIQSPDYIFIDEPEIGLHPKQQEVFVRSLAAKAKRGLIATSHSIALARSTADKIYNIEKNESGTRYCVPFGGNKHSTVTQSISEMSYSQHAELGSNHLLLVEGRTDIKSFREILRKYKIEQHFLIWSLNGSDWVKSNPEEIIGELSELKRLNPKSISIIFDSERESEGAALADELQRFQHTCESLNFNVFATDYHSTENYITQEAINQVSPDHIALTPYQPFGKDGHVKWPKAKNWLMFRDMKKKDLDSTLLGEFIETQLVTLIEQ